MYFFKELAIFTNIVLCTAVAGEEPAVLKEEPEMEYVVEQREKKLFIGLELRTTNKNQEAATAIPAHWGRFYQENILEKIPNKVDHTVLCLYTDYEGDYTQPYSCIIGCEVSSLDQVPSGLVGKTIPASKYAIFKTHGAFPQGLTAVWYAVWDLESKLNRKYTVDFEQYRPEFNPQENPQVKVFIAID